MMTLCLYGGAFDPVHKGHIHFARRICDTFKPDTFFFIPTCFSPFKGHQKYATDKQRLDMLEMAAKAIPNTHVSNLEIDRQGISYTLDTLKYFNELYPGHRMLWVIGDDHVRSLSQWKGYPEHFRYCDFIVLPRYENNIKSFIDEHPFKSQFHLLNAEKINISSTMIREAIKKSQSILSYVPKEINDYILANKMYG